MIYHILPETLAKIIPLKNTSTNRHIESANLINIALGPTLMIPGHHRKDTLPHKCKRSLAKASGKYTHTLAGATELLF